MTPINTESALRAAWQGRRVLVTGGAGFVGSNFVPS
jgi:FlaA1/EpsC-like NDP-sugar epimerase